MSEYEKINPSFAGSTSDDNRNSSVAPGSG